MALRRQQPVHTLVLGCASELHAEELRPAVEAGLRALRCLMASPAVLPGGGCGEVLLAACLRRRLVDVQATASRACGRRLSRLQVSAVVRCWVGGVCGEVLLAACLRRSLVQVQADASRACGRRLSRLQVSAVRRGEVLSRGRLRRGAAGGLLEATFGGGCIWGMW